jgi:hypothetical protein
MIVMFDVEDLCKPRQLVAEGIEESDESGQGAGVRSANDAIKPGGDECANPILAVGVVWPMRDSVPVESRSNLLD